LTGAWNQIFHEQVYQEADEEVRLDVLLLPVPDGADLDRLLRCAEGTLHGIAVAVGLEDLLCRQVPRGEGDVLPIQQFTIPHGCLVALPLEPAAAATADETPPNQPRTPYCRGAARSSLYGSVYAIDTDFVQLYELSLQLLGKDRP